MKTRALFTVLTAVVVSASVFAQDPSYYIRKSTWNESMRASREELMRVQGSGSAFAQKVLGPWYGIGPFKASGKSAFSVVFPPENEVDLSKSYEGGTLKWTRRTDWTDGTVIDLGKESFCATYMFRTITVERDTILPVSLGSDDGIKVWLNGKEILSNNIDRGVEADEESIDLVLKKGENRFLMKVNNNQGGFGFYFHLEDAGVRTIWKLIKRDFADDRSKKEMEWEISDSIWTCDWKPGAWGELAARYLHASQFETKAELARAMMVVEHAGTRNVLPEIRSMYITTHEENNTPYVLTPKPSPSPRINGAKIFGVRPGNPFLYTIPVTGDRPMKFSAAGLPSGLSLDARTGHITGSLMNRGTYTVTLTATNAAGTASREFRIVVGDQIALTPPLGWNSWNCFANAVDDGKVRSAADAMAASGLIDHGWTYINIDDCWEIKPNTDDPALKGEQRDRDGMINTNRKFPDMKRLSDYIHSLGLKMGIYSSPGPLTCAGFTASYTFEENDARQYAAWGIDYLKYDWCSYGRIAKDNSLPELQKPYHVMRAALNSVKRDIVFSLCQYGMGDVWKWGGDVGGNSWRTTGDIEDTWESMSGIGFSQAGHEVYAKPGNWNDPDMLVVGKVGWGPQLRQTKLTPNEQYTHISLWCLLDAPLLIGCDMTQLDEFTTNLLTNDEVLEVSQDPLGKQASRIGKTGDLEVWAKDMEDGSKVVGLFNRGIWKSDITVKWSDLGISGVQSVRDLWRQHNLGRFTDEFTTSVRRHGVTLVRITPVKADH
ncbi:MAG TPA: putative Ig domain-containing protein [Bacteroidota bacterium]|nr:putative Ig domain-containing protein [Bacteroidota bacterium]